MTSDDEFVHLSVDDVLAIHEFIVESSPETTAGVSARGDVEYALEHVQHGQFGQGPETLHEKAAQLVRLLVANHPFVDGNKRTALASAVAFYALNGVRFDYDATVKSYLKRLGTDESAVGGAELRSYLAEHTDTLEPEYEDTYRLWLSLVDASADDAEQNIMTTQGRVGNTMAADDDTEPVPRDLSPEEARRRLMRLIARQDMEAHADIYDELARE